MSTKMIKIFWFLLCVIGMVVQNVFVTIDYFKYTTTTEVLMVMEDEFIPPAFCDCFLPYHVRKTEAFPASHACKRLYSNVYLNECLNYMIFNQTMNRLMNEITFSLRDSVESLAIQSGNDRPKNIKNDQHDKHIDIFLYNGWICRKIRLFSMLSSVNVSKLAFTSDQMYLKVSGYKNFSRLITNNPEEWDLANFFFDPNTFPRGFEIKPKFNVLTNASNVIVFSYMKYDYDFLPPPYFSMCIHYYERNLESRQQCIDECIKNKVRKKFGSNVAVKQLLYTSNEWTSNLNLSIPFSDDSFLNQVIDYYHECKRNCPLGCQSSNYEVELINKWKDIKHSFKYLFVHKNIARKLVFSPKLDPLAYLIYIASVCSLWLGFVIFDSVIFISSSVINHYKPIAIQTNKIHPLLNVANFNVNLVMRHNYEQKE